MTAQPEKQKETGSVTAISWLLKNGSALLAIVIVFGSATLAVAASVLNLTVLQILQAVVGLLALIGASLLTERLVEGRALRERLEAFSGQIDEALEYTHAVKAASLDDLVTSRRELPALEERFEGARRVDISGGSLFRLANEYQNLFERLAEKGCKFRLLMADPEAASAEVLSTTVVYESGDVNTYRTQMKTALTTLSGLANRYPGSFEVRVFTLSPPFSLVITEKEGGKSVVQVEIYTFKLPARERPTLILDKDQAPRLHELFSSQFQTMWSSKFSRPAGSA